MAHDPFRPAGTSGLLRALQASFRLGRFLGVEVQVYWLAVTLLPLVVFAEYARWASGAAEAAVLTVSLVVILYVVVWTHEMGHVLAARRFGMPTDRITLSPLGGLAHIAAPMDRPRTEVLVALAGPAVHLLWMPIALPLWLLVEPFAAAPAGWSFDPVRNAVDVLWWANTVPLVFNLLPVFPLDGGRVLRAGLATRMHPNRATQIACRIGIVGAILFGVLALTGGVGGAILLAIAVTVLLACIGELRATRWTAGPYQGVRPDAWQMDPDAWKRGGTPEPRRPGPIGRWRERRRARAAAQRLEEEADLSAEVDRVLARVSEVGLGGLTASERRILERASQAQRRRPH